MGCTGGAGSCFQKECSVDFCGLEVIGAGSCMGSVSRGVGEACGGLRCAAKSLFNVFSVYR